MKYKSFKEYCNKVIKPGLVKNKLWGIYNVGNIEIEALPYEPLYIKVEILEYEEEKLC